MDIKEYVEIKNYIIVFDTNVLLNIYRYSPEFSDFALNCLKKVQNYIYLPAIVKIEYDRHSRAEFSKMEKRVAEVKGETKKQIEIAEEKILSSLHGMERLHFPDIDQLQVNLSRKIKELFDLLTQYDIDHSPIEFIQHAWSGNDYLSVLVHQIESAGHIMPFPSITDIYYWCEEGKKRYEMNIPPGFMDAKKKDGVSKYSDLIIWKEVLQYAKSNNKNIIFVTDDMKMDWWEIINGNQQFHHKLISDFKNTGKLIEPMISQVFFDEVSKSFEVKRTDAIEIALAMTDRSYCKKISESVFEKIQNELIDVEVPQYIMGMPGIGLEDVEDLEISNYSFIDASRAEIRGSIVYYNFRYHITLECTSYDYWGRDEDTKEVIHSNGRHHYFDGETIITVERDIEDFEDFDNDNAFDDAYVDILWLEETAYEDYFEKDDIYLHGEFGNCPDCGCPLKTDNDGGNGFCINCAANH